MARQDIQVNATYGEVETTDNLTNKVIYDFIDLGDMEGQDNDNYRYGEIVVYPGFESRYSDLAGIHVYIPYMPYPKQLRVRLRIDNPNGAVEYITNKTDNKQWFTVYKGGYENDPGKITLPEYRLLNEKGNYNFLLRDGHLIVFSGDETDFMFKAALSQNEVFLLKALPGNLYQYPTTGVGLIEFLHGNFENTGLAQKLQQEFENDKMTIVDAYMDSNTGELILNVKERNG